MCRILSLKDEVVADFDTMDTKLTTTIIAN